MKLIRFEFNEKIYWGMLKKENVQFIQNDPFFKIQTVSKTVPLDKVKILVPAVASKIVFVGLNYSDHAKELNMELPKEPVIFLKPVSSLIAHGENIVYPEGVTQLDYEAELAVVIRSKCKNVSSEDAKNYILGYTCLNDVTARDLQKKDGQWTRSKSFDTFCPCGPWVETDFKPNSVEVKSILNGKVKQDSNTDKLIFKVDFLISFISKIMTLNAGDIVSTGTPVGVGPMNRGDSIIVKIDGIGELENRIV